MIVLIDLKNLENAKIKYNMPGDFRPAFRMHGFQGSKIFLHGTCYIKMIRPGTPYMAINWR